MSIPATFRNHSLKSRTAGAVTLMFILFSLACGYLGERFLENTIRETIETTQFSYVSALAQSVDDKLELIQNALISSASQIEEDLVADHDKAQYFLNARYSLDSLFKNAMFLFSADGRLIAESPFIAGRRDRDISYREYFRTTMTTGKAFISDPFISTHNQDHPVVIMTAPVRDRKGRIIAVLAGSFDLLGENNVIADLATMKSGKSGYVYLFTTDRTMIMHPDRSRIMKQDTPPGSNILFDRVIAGFEGSGETVNSHGLRFLTSFKRLQKAEWILAANFPSEEAFAPLARARNYYTSAFAVLIVFVAAAVWFMMQRFLAPLDIMARHLRHPDFAGSRLPESFTGNDEIGSLARSFNSMVELQERQRQILRSTDAMYADIFDHIGVGVSLISPEMKILSLNPVMRKWFPKIKRGDPRECFVLFNDPPGTEPCHYCPTIKTLRDGQTHEAVTMTPTPDGIRNYKVVSSPVCDGTGTVVSAIEVVEDITEHVNFEQGLREAKQAAESANRTKSEFLANMSHEIRTPMNGIMGMAQLLSMTELTEEQKEYLGYIESSGRNLLTLINDILDLSKIESGKIELEHADFSLEQAIRDVINTQISGIRAKHLGINCIIGSEIPLPVHGDQLRFKQIMLNLIGNAIKFTEQGEITVTAAIESLVDDTAIVNISVRDTGIGIAPDQQEKIFGAFNQADASTTRRYGGTGLGLTICRRLVELMGGSIGVEGAEGKGSTFNISLPFEVATLAEPVSAAHDIQHPRQGLPLSILAVEDNPTNQKFIGALLRRIGHHVTCSSNGRQALEAWRTAHFDCILMDIQMPVMGGEEALQQIRNDENCSGRHVPVIALTAHALKGDQERFLAQGFDGYLTKPLRIEKLIEQLNQLLPRHCVGYSVNGELS
ncbi:MAG TPA: hypothetical protein DER40_19250 [Geobacter sp.]|nr:hypothetical protein [Geobacter sp.]HCE69555.1 hypothetical protein [Geobacter sp.]